jgi:23S rRNA pseudouridine1911/1915/1917 synthase
MLEVTVPEPQPLNLEPDPIVLAIVYEDDHLLVVNKPRGMVTHPGPGNPRGTLVNALLAHCPLPGINGTMRPGIVHRLDKGTTGLLVVAKSQEAYDTLAADMKARRVKRQYLALVGGTPKESPGLIDAPVGRHPVDRKKMAVVETGRRAVSRYEVLESYKGFSLVRVQLETGRTHQVRVHMASIGHPVASDPTYGGRKAPCLEGPGLHAERLGLCHPVTGQDMEFLAPPPPDFQMALERLRAGA